MAWFVGLSAAIGSAAAQQAPPTTTETALWQQVCATRVSPPISGLRPDFAAARRRCESVAAAAQRYLTIYPGGAHRAEAVRCLMFALFEAGALSGGDFSELRGRIDWYAAHGTTDERAEAAYWRSVLRLDAPPATQPSADASEATDLPAPLAAEALRERFDAASRADDRDAMRRIADALARDCPDAGVTRDVRAILARLDAVGNPFHVSFTDADGRSLDTSAWVGAPVAIVVWESGDAASRATLVEAEALRRANPELRLVGVNLDVRLTDCQRTCAAAQIEWPQWSAGLGAAHPFARAWGVERSPMVFVIGRDGRLRGATGDERWKSLVRGALERGG